MISSNATIDTVNLYRERGYDAVIPLPNGDKSPPPAGKTGGVPALTQDEVNELWQSISYDNNRNLGLRMQAPQGAEWDLISIDVDNYGAKEGDLYLSDLERQIGSLNRETAHRSSRRGPNNPSGQHLFRVPKGLKWKSSACSDVDVIQLTHRYAAVWPSVVDDLQYVWYVGEDEAEIPLFDDLPLLPDTWVEFLQKGGVGALTRRPAKTFTGVRGDRYREAHQWLRENLSGYARGTEDISKSLHEASNGERLMTRLEGNAHDTMVGAVHRIVMHGVEGHVGVKQALSLLRVNFIGIVTTRDSNYRSQAEAEREFEDALISEVERLIAEIGEGMTEIVDITEDLAMPNFSAKVSSGRIDTESKPQSVDWMAYGDTDRDYAEMFAEYWGKDCLVTRDLGPAEFAMWVEKDRRYLWRSKDEMLGFVNDAIGNRLDYEREKLKLELDNLGISAGEAQLDVDDPDEEEIQGKINTLKRRSDSMKQTRNQKSMLSQLHSIEDLAIKAEDMDDKGQFIGIYGGMTLDITQMGTDKALRRSERSDMLTMNTEVTLIPGHRDEVWDDFLKRVQPDVKLRKFTQKVLGYSLSHGNPSKVAIFLYGGKDTGKSTILEACSAALGDYGGPMQMGKIYGKRSDGPTPEIIANINKLMVTMSEAGIGETLSSNAIKQVTGNDKQQLRGAHKNETLHKIPRFTPYASTNSAPSIPDGDKALQGRLLVLPFDHATPARAVPFEKDVVRNPQILVSVLAWLVEGFEMYMNEGLDPDTWPEEVTAASNLFAGSVSPLDQFIKDALDKTGDKESVIIGDALYAAWKAWCSKEGIFDSKDIGSRSSFYQKLKANGMPMRMNTKYQGKSGVTLLREYILK